MKEMRRKDRLLDREDAMNILEKGEYGILSTIGSDEQPYGVPLSYVVKDNCIYFHATNQGGSKYDNILHNKKVSFTVVMNTEVLPDQFATLYESAIAFGEAEVVKDETKRLEAFREFLYKYSPDFLSEGEKYIASAGSSADIVKIEIKDLTGKGRRQK